jgi:HAD superfamily hydrolase (TIGR01509 family)
VDGVIADTEPLSTKATSQTFWDLYKVAIKNEDSLAFMGATSEMHVLGIATQYNISIDLEQTLAAKQTIFFEALEELQSLVFPGVEKLFSRAADSDEWKLALATSSDRMRSEKTLLKTGLDTSRLNAWLTGNDITKPKPDPEIYQAAALAIGVSPSNCVVIEDSVAGITAAKEAGMSCIGVTNTFSGEELRDADRIVDSLEAVDITLLHDLIHETNV